MNTLLLGDISVTKETAPYYQAQDIQELYTDVVSVFARKDFVFANLECALTDHEVFIQKFGPPLKGPVETARVLKALGVTCCGLSNNHVFDFGIRGAEDTLQALEAAGLAYTGFGRDYEDSRKNYTFEKNGEKICIIAVCEREYSYALEDRMGSRPYDEYHTMEDIRAAKVQHDRVIVIYHGGKEYCQYPSPRLRRLCQAMARSGADLVLCQHSHCIGTYEFYNDCHILYGQGNFHFVCPSTHAEWDTGLAVTYDTKAHTVEFIPVVRGEHGIRLAAGTEKEEILTSFEARNAALHDGRWKEGWHSFCESMKAGYYKAIAEACLETSTDRQNHRFAHYLDCEAHTDVWRELFPTSNQTNEK